MDKKASKTGTYTVGGGYYLFVAGDDLPDGASFVAAQPTGEPEDREEQQSRAEAKALADAEARAKGKAPENR